MKTTRILQLVVVGLLFSYSTAARALDPKVTPREGALLVDKIVP